VTDPALTGRGSSQATPAAPGSGSPTIRRILFSLTENAPLRSKFPVNGRDHTVKFHFCLPLRVGTVSGHSGSSHAPRGGP
jgi:hypothetical protein